MLEPHLLDMKVFCPLASIHGKLAQVNFNFIQAHSEDLFKKKGKATCKDLELNVEAWAILGLRRCDRKHVQFQLLEC